MNVHTEATPSGWMGNPARGASMGRGDSDRAEMIESERRNVECLASAVAHIAPYVEFGFPRPSWCSVIREGEPMPSEVLFTWKPMNVRRDRNDLFVQTYFDTASDRELLATQRLNLAIARARLARLQETPESPERFSLRTVRLDSGGYDSGGAYWGIGARLYVAESDCGTVSRFFRARDRAAARAEIRAEFPAAKLYR